MVEVGEGWGKRGVNGLRGQRSGSLASKGVYCSTGWVLVDELLSWVFFLRDHIFGSRTLRGRKVPLEERGEVGWGRREKEELKEGL